MFRTFRITHYNTGNLAHLPGTVLPGLFFLYLFVIPLFDLLPGVGVYNEKRLLELLLLLACGLVLISSRSLRENWLNTFLSLSKTGRALLMVIPLSGLLSALLSPEPPRAFEEVLLYLLIGITAFAIAAAWQQTARDNDRQTMTWLASALLIIMLGHATRFYSSLLAAWLAADTPLVQFALFNNFAHVRFFSQFQSWTLGLAVLPLLVFHHQTLLFRLALFAAGSWWLMLFTSGTRGTLLGIIVAFIAIALLFGFQARTWLKWMTVTALLGMAGYILLFTALPALFHSEAASVLTHTIERNIVHSSGRWYLWERALAMMQAHPLLGAGPMHYACDSGNRIAAHPHNSLLQIASEWGLPVAAAVVYLFFSALRSWIQQTLNLNKNRNNRRLIHIALLAALLTAGTHALFSGIPIMPLSQVSMIMVIGTMLALNAPPRTISFSVHPAAHYTLIAVCALTLLALGALMLPYLFQIEMLQTEANISRWLMPRLWQQGRICDLP